MSALRELTRAVLSRLVSTPTIHSTVFAILAMKVRLAQTSTNAQEELTPVTQSLRHATTLPAITNASALPDTKEISPVFA